MRHFVALLSKMKLRMSSVPCDAGLVIRFCLNGRCDDVMCVLCMMGPYSCYMVGCRREVRYVVAKVDREGG